MLSVPLFPFPSFGYAKYCSKKSQPRSQVKECSPGLPLHHIHSILTILLCFPSDYHQTKATQDSSCMTLEYRSAPPQRSDDTRYHFIWKWANQIPGLVVCDPTLPSDDRVSSQEIMINIIVTPNKMSGKSEHITMRYDPTSADLYFILMYSLAVFNHDYNALESCSFCSKCISCYRIL